MMVLHVKHKHDVPYHVHTNKTMDTRMTEQNKPSRLMKKTQLQLKKKKKSRRNNVMGKKRLVLKSSNSFKVYLD